MKRLLNYMMFIGIASLAISCAEPQEPSAGERVIGNWSVVEYYVQGQVDDGDLIDRLIIERDGNFILEDGNGVLTVVTWSADDTALTLSPAEGEAIVLNIVTLTYSKGHFIQNLSSPILGDVEIRYLLDNEGEGDYSGSGT